MDVEYDERKLTELIVYVADRLRSDRADGATKLNKVLFFADFAHVRKHRRPITGAEYQKLPYGPAPRRLMPIRKALVSAGAATLVEEKFSDACSIASYPIAMPAFVIALLAEFPGVQIASKSPTELEFARRES
jgi:hypothetical protein